MVEQLKGTPGYKNKLILIDRESLERTNGATSNFIEKLGSLSSFGPASLLSLCQCPQAWP